MDEGPRVPDPKQTEPDAWSDSQWRTFCLWAYTRRVQGATYTDILDTCDMNGYERVTYETVHKAVTDEAHRRYSVDPITERQLALDRLDGMVQQLDRLVQAGSFKAIDQAMTVMTTRLELIDACVAADGEVGEVEKPAYESQVDAVLAEAMARVRQQEEMLR